MSQIESKMITELEKYALLSPTFAQLSEKGHISTM